MISNKLEEWIDRESEYCGDLNQGELMLPVHKIDSLTTDIKREAIEELLSLHKQDRAKVNSQCDSLINMSTVDKYLRSLG